MAVKMMKRDEIDVSVKHEADFTELFHYATEGKTIKIYYYVKNDEFEKGLSTMDEPERKREYVDTHYEAALFLELCDSDGVKYIDKKVRDAQRIGTDRSRSMLAENVITTFLQQAIVTIQPLAENKLCVVDSKLQNWLIKDGEWILSDFGAATTYKTPKQNHYDNLWHIATKGTHYSNLDWKIINSTKQKTDALYDYLDILYNEIESVDVIDTIAVGIDIYYQITGDPLMKELYYYGFPPSDDPKQNSTGKLHYLTSKQIKQVDNTWASNIRELLIKFFYLSELQANKKLPVGTLTWTNLNKQLQHIRGRKLILPRCGGKDKSTIPNPQLL
eukprot:512526_1